MLAQRCFHKMLGIPFPGRNLWYIPGLLLYKVRLTVKLRRSLVTGEERKTSPDEFRISDRIPNGAIATPTRGGRREMVETMYRDAARAATGERAWAMRAGLTHTHKHTRKNCELPTHVMNALHLFMQKVYSFWAILRLAKLERGLRGTAAQYYEGIPRRRFCYSGSMWIGRTPSEVRPYALRDRLNLSGASR